ncbi:malate synthase A [Bacillus sp. 2205SS5-2]|uniref:malate synthase A n=1 Tax=Bacillus sp. 2205SS5-2 TaxID=3109031 RepID=UPI0030062AED
MTTQTAGIKVNGRMEEGFQEILTPEALQFIEQLERRFGVHRLDLLQARREKQEKLNQGEQFTFLSESEHIRRCDWTIAPLPEALQDRRVEITGPVDRKMVINALNSGAKSFMACFEDATSPTWENVIEGQINMRDAVCGSISFGGQNGKNYVLNKETAIINVRPRGLHLEEKQITLDGHSISASFVDFGLFFFHNAARLVQEDRGPYFYLPKLESHLEARLWNDVFVYAQKYIGIPRGTIKATVLIETLPAVFEMDEILFELREHSAGLNCGRWDYIFSYIKKLREKEDVILPDRSQVTMTVPFMRKYSLLTIQTCHKRLAPAMGGMAAQIPVKNDEKKNEEAYNKVRADKEREAKDGHDGTWVAHPGLVPVAYEAFNREMSEPNQIRTKKQEQVKVTAEELVDVPQGTITEEGVRLNINVGIQYIASWLSGRGAAPINNLMEDAATAEISRAQLWQWLRHPKGVLEDGRKVSLELYDELQQEELENIQKEVGQEIYKNGRYEQAVELFDSLIKEDKFVDFLTIPGYKLLQ